MSVIRIIFLSILLTSCIDFGAKEAHRKPKDSLTKACAFERSESLSNVSYDLQIDLTQSKNFQGTSLVSFNLSKKFPLSLDFAKGEVQEIWVNDAPIATTHYNGFFVTIPESHQKLGANKVLIKYTHDYSNDGQGLYRYVDVKDKKVYLYTQFEPYKANRLFPCFDQPDLKATYTMNVLAPSSWVVVTSVRETSVAERGDYREWSFPESKKFSTYTFSLHAGDYKIWEDEAKTKHHTIPLRLMARQSLAQFVNPEEWFNLTKSSFLFFEKYFSMPYPYLKYDQLIVPDFNWGAMENVAAVTFNEDRFVSKGKKTREQEMRLAGTLYHEMAHMWFGNLVTMKWWDDLWLNESFATHSSYVGLAESTDFEEAWRNFLNRKEGAYLLDQSINTHPIALEVKSTDEGFANFDAITYGKGASVMKQLSFLLGKKTYRKALKNYFAKYAEQNTELKDFMGMMSETSGKDLSNWEQRWLKTAMLNEVEVHFTCTKNKIDNFEIYQTGTKEYPTLRTHKTRVALFKKWAGSYSLNRTASVEYSGERTHVKEFVGKPCPHLAFPNYQDHDYVIVNLDKKSLKNIQSDLLNIKDPFLRASLWANLWMMVVNQKLDMNRYLEIVEYNGLAESDQNSLVTLLENVERVLQFYYPNQGNPWRANRQVWVKFFEQAYLTKINETQDNPDLQKIWFKSLVSLAESPTVLRMIEKKIKRHISGLQLKFKLDQDMRWQMISALTRNDYASSEELLRLEKRKDASKRGQLNALFAEAVTPKIETKKKFFKQVTQPDQAQSFGALRTIMWALFPGQQDNLQKQFVDSFYNNLGQITKTKDPMYAVQYSRSLVPTFCDRKSSTRIKNFIEAEKGLAFSITKTLKGAMHANDRCYGMRKILKERGKNESPEQKAY